MMQLQFRIAGVLMILLAVLHVFFPRHFDWKRELRLLSLVNRQMMQVHLFFIAFAVFLMGLLCLTSGDQLLHTTLGRRISFGLTVFWAVRLCFQFFVYSPALWKGKRFEKTIHIGFSLLWTFFTVVFLLAWLDK
ncbi:MAG TPA: hypothetical protein VHE54_12300 [Puia sp.]|nr:hypothetical protein [Puia sp.]